MKDKKLHVAGRIWVESAKGPILGYGRIELLQKIQEFGSITKAAAAMKMSYSQAWELIDSMNENVDQPIVIKQTGGKGGGGALVTTYGQKLIDNFDKVNRMFQVFLRELSDELNNS